MIPMKPILTCAMLGLLCSQLSFAQITIEDFKGAGGFDLGWLAPVVEIGSGETTFSSNGEIGKLQSTVSDQTVVVVEQTNTPIVWDRTTKRYAQVMVPNLPYGKRCLINVRSETDGYAEHLLHDQWTAIPGQGPRPQTFDVNAALPATPNQQNILIQIKVIEEGYGAGKPTEVNIDWMKLGMNSVADTPTTYPVRVSPADGATVSNRPTLQWAAPAGFAGNTYTVTYSKDPLFSDATTVTVLDSVTGTSFVPNSALSNGLWYWTVSATAASGISGPFMEKGLVPEQDPRDPQTHLFYSFNVQGEPTAARHWSTLD